jgi:hypothetical protein
MQSFRHLRTMPALLLVLAGCDRGVTTPDPPLQPAQVAGVYAVCELTFSPAGTLLPAIDLRAAVMDTAPAPQLPRPNLKVGLREPTFELEYTPKGDFIPRRFDGRYDLTRQTATFTLAAPAQAQARTALLLPNPLVLRPDPEARELRIGPDQPRYLVPRADYARLAGVAEVNLPPQIDGALAGRFAIDCR